MTTRRLLLMYIEQGVLKVCVPPGEILCTVPMVAARKQEMPAVFGNRALAKDKSWELNWFQGGEVQHGLFRDFIDFVLQQPVVFEVAYKCTQLLLGVQPVLVPASNGKQEHFDSNTAYSFFYQQLSLTVTIRVISYLSLYGRDDIDVRYCLNVEADYARIRSLNSIRFHKTYIKVGFDTIVNLFIKLLCEKGYDFTVAKDRLLCYNLVMDCCYVALDFDKEMERIEKLDEPLHEITMEDGTVLELGKECIVAPEVLFNPGLAGIDEDGIMSLFRIYDVAALSALPPLILSGGCATSLNGLSERIQKEFTKGKNVDLQIMKSNPKEDALRWHEWLICTEFGS